MASYGINFFIFSVVKVSDNALQTSFFLAVKIIKKNKKHF